MKFHTMVGDSESSERLLKPPRGLVLLLPREGVAARFTGTPPNGWSPAATALVFKSPQGVRIQGPRGDAPRP